MLVMSKGRERITTTNTKPTGFDTGDGVLSVQLTALNGTGCIVASDHLSREGSYIGAAASETFKDGALGSENDYTGFGASNLEGLFSVWRQYNENGQIDPAKDVLFTQIGEKGVEFYAYSRKGKKGEAAWAAGDEGYVYQCVSDEPQDPRDRNGFIKNDIALSVQKRRKFRVAA